MMRGWKRAGLRLRYRVSPLPDRPVAGAQLHRMCGFYQYRLSSVYDAQLLPASQADSRTVLCRLPAATGDQPAMLPADHPLGNYDDLLTGKVPSSL